MRTRIFLEAENRRLRCGACKRVVTEEVAWARHGARHTVLLLCAATLRGEMERIVCDHDDGLTNAMC